MIEKVGQSYVLLDRDGPCNKNIFFKTAKYNVQLIVTRNTVCTLGKGNRMLERI